MESHAQPGPDQAMELWLQSRVQLANINLELARVSEGEPLANHQNTSIQALRETVEYLSKNGTREQLAATQNILGTSLLDKADASLLAERNSVLTQARDFFLEALQVFKRSDHPREFAMVSNNLGITFHKLSQWPFDGDPTGKGKLQERASAHYKDALEVYETLGNPGQAALMKMNMAFLDPRKGNQKEALEKAALALESAVASPGNGANAQLKMNLATCLMELAELEAENRGQRIDRAISLLQSLQGVRSSNPRRWARIESQLGQAHLAASLCDSRKKWTHLRASAQASGDALSVFTERASPADWAGNQARLGMATALLSGDPALGAKERDKILVEGLVAIIEATNHLTTNQTFRQEGEALLKDLRKVRTVPSGGQ